MEVTLILYRGGKAPQTLDDNLERIYVQLKEVVSVEDDAVVLAITSKSELDIKLMSSIKLDKEAMPTMGVFETTGATLFLSRASVSEVNYK